MTSTNSSDVAIVWGTRPEHIKLFPVWRELKGRGIKTTTFFTGQHCDLVDHENLPIDIDYSLKGLDNFLKSKADFRFFDIYKALQEQDFDPKLVLVQGDTFSALAASLVSFYRNIPVGHIEAGLTSGDPNDPFPEEMHRRLIREMMAFHFAPTYESMINLSNVAVDRNVHVTGNTIVDTVDYMIDNNLIGMNSEQTNEVLVTIHRRENDVCLEDICKAICELGSLLPDYKFVIITHPRNARVINEITHERGWSSKPKSENLTTIPYLDYVTFLNRMVRSRFVITDSGGLQEEGTVLGIPVFVIRRVTERTEAVKANFSKLVGVKKSGIISGVMEGVLDSAFISRRERSNIYGDGKASGRIVDIIERSI